MTKLDLCHIANMDTPKNVEIPPTMVGVVTWLVGRFGVGALIAVAFGAFALQIYEDLKIQNEKILEAFVDQTKTSAENIAALRELTKAVETLEKR